MCSNLLLDALVLVVKAVIRAIGGMAGQVAHHFILVKIHLTRVAVVVLIIIVKDAALAIRYLLFIS